ncbi:MAG TPA: hypothetical protein VHL57_11055, partial [Flavobacteriales bacterium]|nr:hypothetical protein [Flavobacteriales bacterium]
MNPLVLLIGSRMTLSVKVIIGGIAVVLFFALRLLLFTRGSRSAASYVWPALLALILAPLVWL